MELRILGPLEAYERGASLALGGPKPRALLARLALDLNRTVAVERLVDDLWGEDVPVSATKMVQIYVSQLRKALPDGALRTQAPGYVLEAEPEALDLTRFERLREGERFAEALALWRGPALAEFSEPFALAEAARLEELRLGCLESRIDADLADGGHAELVGELEALAREHPLRETPHRQLMLALYRAGREAEALAAYDRFRRTLDEDLGIQPSESLKRLQGQVLNQDPELSPRGAAPAAGVVTLLFTDLVGSTELIGRLGHDTAEKLRREHFTLLREAITTHGGSEVKNLGDGLMVVFASAVAAARCATDIQLAVSGEGSLAVRIGLHAGEPAREGDDFFGVPVVIAKRLCDHAGGGQILASDLVRGLVGPHDGPELVPLGELSLKGLVEPVTAFEVRWTGHGPGEPPAPPGRIDLPRALADAGRAPFVGRDGALERLHGAWENARGGRLHLAMVGGEPGIGKTRLAAQFAQAAHDREATVLYGRCDEELGIPYQPFAEALGGGFPALGQASAAGPAEPATQRQRLFEAIVSLLEGFAGEQPLVVVLDDLHWADAQTLLFLRYLVRSPSAPPMLLIGTFRDTEVSRDHPLARTLADLWRGAPVERVSLSGLPRDDFGQMLGALAGRQPPAELVRTIHDETEGNPFFGAEVLRHLEESGGVGIPEGVKETIGRRLARLPAGCEEALATAAVLGRTWEYELVRAMGPESGDDLLDSVEAALAARLIVDSPGGGDSPAYSFSHALVRETLYDDLSKPRRQQLHLRAAEAIERVHASELDDHAAALAGHLGLAGAAAAPEVALRWRMRAGELAAAQLAWEEAAAHWDAAAGLMPAAGVDDGDRIALLERLADLRFAANFELLESTAQLEEALAYHERAGNRARVARLRSRIGRNLTTFHGPVQDIRRGREQLEAAEVVIAEEGDGVPLASVYIGLATAVTWAGDVPQILRTAERAMGIAERLGNDTMWANASVLYGNGMTWAGRGEEAETHLKGAWEIGDRVNNPWVPFLATWCWLGDLFWRGEIARGRRVCEREMEKPRTIQAPGQLEYLESLQAWAATLSGDLAPAMAFVERSSPDDVPPFAAGLVQLMAGDPGTIRETIEGWRQQWAARGNTWTAMCFEHDLAQAQWLLDDPAVDETYARIIATATATGAGLFELIYRCQFARRLVERGLISEASDEVGRARELFASGTRWGAREADLALAEATVAAAGGDDAEALFSGACQTYERHGVVWDQAEAFTQWGSALAPRNPAAATAMFDRALELYDRFGASAAWRERVLRRQPAAR